MKYKLLEYFDLGIYQDDVSQEPVLGNKKKGRKRNRKKWGWSLALYFGVVLGALCQQFLVSRTELKGIALVSSIIVGTVVFPQIYKQAHLDRKKPNLMQLFIAFQSGFFWQNTMNALQK